MIEVFGGGVASCAHTHTHTCVISTSVRVAKRVEYIVGTARKEGNKV